MNQKYQDRPPLFINIAGSRQAALTPSSAWRIFLPFNQSRVGARSSGMVADTRRALQARLHLTIASHRHCELGLPANFLIGSDGASAPFSMSGTHAIVVHSRLLTSSAPTKTESHWLTTRNVTDRRDRAAPAANRCVPARSNPPVHTKSTRRYAGSCEECLFRLVRTTSAGPSRSFFEDGSTPFVAALWHSYVP